MVGIPTVMIRCFQRRHGRPGHHAPSIQWALSLATVWAGRIKWTCSARCCETRYAAGRPERSRVVSGNRNIPNTGAMIAGARHIARNKQLQANEKAQTASGLSLFVWLVKNKA